ncbi:MAG: tyrosine-type recombinase/integrase [Prevotella sp.]|nr:tyrosine-type recombinase/integrase [Prevotella sp.]
MITTALVFDHRGRTKPGQEGPIELRVTYNRKPYYINTGIKVRGRELYDGRITGRRDALVLQDRLDIVVEKIERAVTACIEKGLEINVAAIRSQLYNLGASGGCDGGDMLAWMEEQVPMLKIKETTRRRYDVLMSRLREFGKLTAWSDLSVENIYLFDTWLHGLRRPSSNGDVQAGRVREAIGDATVFNYHKSLKSLLNRAIKFGIIKTSPYSRLRGEFSRGVNENVEYLNEEEIAAVESLRPMEGTQVAMARDLFVFQMYTGLSYSDTQAFDMSAYKKVGGRWVSVSSRVKTGVPYVSQLLPQAIDVLERYGWQVPKMGNTQYNESLKVIQQALGIRTRMHSHLARHTFATRALSMGVKIENVSRMLGHTNITQTQRYAKVLAQSVMDDFDMMAEKTGGKR